ncbi:MAG TPA: hypothetical protein VNM39_13205 [Verrucomicrobiae bacterium]|nr:hypothetical protein [Verrucomicrobiae bacterium]
MIDRWWLLSTLPVGTTTLNMRPRLLGARLIGLELRVAVPSGIYVHSVRVGFDEKLDCWPHIAREIPIRTFPVDPQPDGFFEPLNLKWLPTRVIDAGAPGITLGFVNDTRSPRHLLSRTIWEGYEQ